MKRNWRLRLLIPGVATLIAIPLNAQTPNRPANTTAEQDDVVRVDTTLVTVPVSVKDRQRKSMLNLRREDFHLFEDGVEQEIAYFGSPEAASEKPLTVALLLDISDSTEFKLRQIQDAAVAFIDQLGAEDRVIVLAFDSRVQVLAEPTTDRNVLREAVGRARTGRGTSLYDAVETIINQRLNRISGRKSIVLFTDGVDTTSKRATYDSTVRAAEQLDAAIYPIQYDTYSDFTDNPSRQTYSPGTSPTAHMTKSGELASEAYKRATIYLRSLAERTGGRFEYTDSIKSLSQSFARLASELRQEYTLGYYPKKQTMDQTRRELKVSVSTPDAVVRARKSYIYKRTDRQ